MRHPTLFVATSLALAGPGRAAVSSAPHAGALAAQPRDSVALPRVTPAVRALAGCYRLAVVYPGAGARARAWLRPGPPLPRLVRLDTAAQRTFARPPDFRAAPDVTAHHEFPSAPGWRPAGRDALVVTWWDGFAGTTLDLARAGAAWRGVARYDEDVVPSPVRRADVVATRVACPT